MDILVEKNPLISVILPIRNQAEYLSSAIESLLAQNHTNIEIIAIDDFSKDNSLEILNSYRLDKRLKISANVKRYGLGVTLNRCIKQVKGNFILFMDPRDTITKNKLSKQLDYLYKHKKTIAVGTQCYYISEDNKRLGKSYFPTQHKDILQKPIHGMSVLFEGVMINKYKVPKDLLYFPTNKNTLIYSDIMLKLLQYGHFANLSEYLHLHRTHSSQIKSTTKYIVAMTKLWFKSLTQYEYTLPFKTLITTLSPK